MKRTYLAVFMNISALLIFASLIMPDNSEPLSMQIQKTTGQREKPSILSMAKPVAISSIKMPPLPEQKVKHSEQQLSLLKLQPIKKAEIGQNKTEVEKHLKVSSFSKFKAKNTYKLGALHPVTDKQHHPSLTPLPRPQPKQALDNKSENEVRIKKSLSKTIEQPALTPIQAKKFEREVAISANDISRGMVILSDAEEGETLNFELFWPQDRYQSEILYSILSNCYGMQSALLDDVGNLYFPAQKRGNLPSGFSPLLHQVSQVAAPVEGQKLQALRKKHKLTETTMALRVHRRTTHAALLSGLEKLAKKPLSTLDSVSARYHLNKGELFVSDIEFNHVPMLGRIILGRSSCKS